MFKFALRQNLPLKDSLIKSFCICYFWSTKRKSTETIKERCVHVKIITGWGVSDIQNNLGWGRNYLDLDYSGYQIKIKANVIILLFYHIFEQKIEFMFFASLLMASSTKHANLTWLPLEIMHCSQTWHDYMYIHQGCH